jgi:hypothetical protein
MAHHRRVPALEAGFARPSPKFRRGEVRPHPDQCQESPLSNPLPARPGARIVARMICKVYFPL